MSEMTLIFRLYKLTNAGCNYMWTACRSWCQTVAGHSDTVEPSKLSKSNAVSIIVVSCNNLNLLALKTAMPLLLFPFLGNLSAHVWFWFDGTFKSLGSCLTGRGLTVLWLSSSLIVATSFSRLYETFWQDDSAGNLEEACLCIISIRCWQASLEDIRFSFEPMLYDNYKFRNFKRINFKSLRQHYLSKQQDLNLNCDSCMQNDRCWNKDGSLYFLTSNLH